MRRVLASRCLRLLLLAAVLGCHAPTAGADGDSLRALEGIQKVEGTRVLDLTGDGVAELAVLDGRTLHVFQAEGGELPSARASFRVTLPDDALFIDLLAAPKDGEGRLVVIGGEETRVLPLRDKAEPVLVTGAETPGWTDPEGPTLAPLVGGDRMLLPTEEGLGWFLGETGELILGWSIPRDRHVEAPGPFVEDQSVITEAVPTLLLAHDPRANMPGDAGAAWALMDGGLVALGDGGRTRYELAFLPATGERRILDVNGDGYPDVLHIETTNRTGRYAFFKTRPLTSDTPTPPSHRPANSVLSLTGFQLEPQFADLDKDGDLDLVLTTIAVDGTNTVRAVTQRKVEAITQAFLNRGGAGRWFEASPDARVSSDVGVRIRFTYEGSLEVERTVTIVADGDYDGDGASDLMIRTGPGTFTLRRGTASGVWEAEGRTVSVPAAGEGVNMAGEAADLDGDGKDELLLTYTAREGGSDQLVVVRPGR